MTGIMDKIRSFSKERSASRERAEEHTPHQHSHLNPAFADTPEEEGSRGREFVPTGRGGAGNMSRSRGRQPNPNGNDETPEVLAAARSTSRSRTRGTSRPVGRGGAGNIIEPAEDPVADRLDKEDAQVIATYDKEHSQDRLMGGRGGVGNVGTVTLEESIAAAKDDPTFED